MPNPHVETKAPSVAGPIAVVTGAASGIGRATAFALAADGTAVVGIDVDEIGLRHTVADIVGAGGDAVGVPADLADPASITAAAATAIAWRGRIDVLAHVAGVGLYAHAEDVTVAHWDHVLNINLRAPFLLTQALLDPLLAARGAVVAVSSIAGIEGWPYSTVYSASKGGLTTMMRSFAIEYGPRGLRCNVVCPGSVLTAMATTGPPLPDADPGIAKRGVGLTGRRADPAEVAAVICFLASSAASFVSGAVLPVDGGASA